MNEKKSLIQRITSFFPGGEKKPTTLQYVIVILVLGIAFMLVSNIVTSNQSQTIETMNTTNQNQEQAVFKQKDSNNSSIRSYEDEYENQLKEALETMIGVDDVTVVVNVESTSEKVLEKNKVIQSQKTNETDREGGTRKVEDQSIDEQVVIVRQGDKEAPIVIKTEKPEIRGVLIVAKGAENVQIKKMIIDAVTRVLDVPSHKVAVLPKKTKEE